MVKKLPALKPRKVLKALKKAGFYIHHQRGSHIHLKHSDYPKKRIVIPYHNRDLAPKTLRSIIKQANLTIEEFIDLL